MPVANGQLISGVKTDRFSCPSGHGITPCCPGIKQMTRLDDFKKGLSIGAAKPYPRTVCPFVSPNKRSTLSLKARCTIRPNLVR